MTTQPDAVSAIVLAGGRSSRFGRDKLAASLGGRPLLDHAVGAVAALAAEVIVVVAPNAPTTTARALPGVELRTVHDPEPFGGPLVGLLAGLRAARSSVAIVVGGDMPGLAPDVLRVLVARAADAGSAAVLADPREPGRARPLPLAVAVEPGRAAASALVLDGERRLRALVAALDAVVVDAETWLALDPDGRTLLDVDRPEDLSADGLHVVLADPSADSGARTAGVPDAENPKPPPGGKRGSRLGR